MTTIDYIIFGIGAAALIFGAVRGFAAQLGSLAGLICGILACRLFGGTVAAKLTDGGAVASMLSYALVFAVVFVGVSLLARLLGAMLTAMKMGTVNRLCGAALTLALWMFFLSMLLNMYIAVAPGARADFAVPDKPWREKIVAYSPALLGFISELKKTDIDT